MSDDTGLNEGVEGSKLSKDGFSIDGGFPVKVLVSGSSTNRFHQASPEVVGVSADGVASRFESDFDFEAQGIDFDDVQRVQGEIGSHENDITP